MSGDLGVVPAESWPTGSERAGRPTRLASVAKRITALSSVRSDAPHFKSCRLRTRRRPASARPHTAPQGATAVQRVCNVQMSLLPTTS